MVKALRKRHLQVWSVLAVLLPIGILAAVVAVPGKQFANLLQPDAVATLPVAQKTSESPGYRVVLRSNEDASAFQLEWTNNQVLTAPSALIYQTDNANDPVDNALLIGRVEGRGTYRFPVKNAGINGFHFVLYDIIHHKVIHSIHL